MKYYKKFFMDFKENLYRYFENKENLMYSVPIIRSLFQHLKSKKINDKTIGKYLEDEYLLSEKIPEIFEILKNEAIKNKQYPACFFPTIISKKDAPNFYLFKEYPSEDEIYKFFYLLITGIYHRTKDELYVVNIDSQNENLFKNFREFLINENILIIPKKIEKSMSGINIDSIVSKLNLKIFKGINFSREFIFSFIVVSSFALWIKENLNKKIYKEELEKEIGVELILDSLDINDNINLIVFKLSRSKKTKKEMYSISRLRKIIVKWYKDFIEDREKSPAIVQFIFSFYYNDDYCLDRLNKFLYYFLNGHINGELLDKLINFKISYELNRKKKPFGIINAKKFFLTLSKN